MADDKIIEILLSLASSMHTTAETVALQQKVQELETEQAELEKSGPGRLRKLLKGFFGD